MKAAVKKRRKEIKKLKGQLAEIKKTRRSATDNLTAVDAAAVEHAASIT